MEILKRRRQSSGAPFMATSDEIEALWLDSKLLKEFLNLWMSQGDMRTEAEARAAMQKQVDDFNKLFENQSDPFDEIGLNET